MLVLVKLGQHWRLWRGWASVESSLQIMEHHCKLGFIHSAVCAALCITLRSCTLWCMLNIASLLMNSILRSSWCTLVQKVVSWF